MREEREGTAEERGQMTSEGQRIRKRVRATVDAGCIN